MKTKLIIAAAAFALAAPAAAAPDPAVSAIVEYSDLDLTTEAGLARLERRMVRAAEQVCGYVPARGLGEIERVTECQEEALLNAHGQVERALASAGNGDVRLAQNLVRRAR